ncbi:MAG: DNA repair protein RecN, partial [Pseudomonadota bacterium]
QVSNFAIIESIHMEFDEGLNIISGETGAGKSILLRSLALLMGGKSQADTVASGANQATIEGRFDITGREDILERLFEAGIDAEDSSLVVKRVIGSQGKSKVYINGSLSTVSTLRDLVSPLITVTGQAAPLIEMTGQHDNRHLQSKSYHLDIVDQFSGSFSLRDRFTDLFNENLDLQNQIENLRAKEMEREQRLDFLSFQVDEINSLGLQSGEEETLETEFRRLNNASKVMEFATLAERAIDQDEDSALTRLQRILGRASELSKLDPELSNKTAGLEQAVTMIEECLYDLRHYCGSFDMDPSSQAAVEERMSAFKKLQKKHGETADEILQKLEAMNAELNDLQDSEAVIAGLEKRRDQNALELKALGQQLHEARLKSSVGLSSKVNKELQDLNMKGVTLVISVESTTMNSKGTSDVEFLIQSAKGDTARSIAKFASGGELSRILLALKKVIGHDEHPRTYLFDEVDAGVSGPTAEKVGKKLLQISDGQQVICVTHLPQVACFADHHFLIEKTSQKTKTQMQVQALEKEDRVLEIARLISGEKITKTSTEHARELLSQR